MEFSKREIKTLKVMIYTMREELNAETPSIELDSYEEIELVADALDYALARHEEIENG